MKKLLLLIILCPTTNMLAMISTKAIPLAQIASLATRFIHTTKTYQQTPTFPTSQNYRSMKYLEETKIRARLKKQAYEQAYEENANLKEECKAFIMILEQRKSEIPFS